MKILWVNVCAHEASRTLELSREFIGKYCEKHSVEVEIEEMRLFEEKNLDLFDWERVNERLRLQKLKQWENPMFDYARQWIEADRIIVSAPYWDLSFPAVLKVYMENIFVTGLSFYYDANGIPKGLSRADKLLYITTSGGPVKDKDMGYEYISGCAKMLGIYETKRLAAEGLDVLQWDGSAILQKAKLCAAELAKTW